MTRTKFSTVDKTIAAGLFVMSYLLVSMLLLAPPKSWALDHGYITLAAADLPGAYLLP